MEKKIDFFWTNVAENYPDEFQEFQTWLSHYMVDDRHQLLLAAHTYFRNLPWEMQAGVIARFIGEVWQYDVDVDLTQYLDVLQILREKFAQRFMEQLALDKEGGQL